MKEEELSTCKLDCFQNDNVRLVVGINSEYCRHDERKTEMTIMINKEMKNVACCIN